MAGGAIRLIIRRATRGDVPAIVRLLADDVLGAQREQPAEPVPAAYVAAFEAIDGDPRHALLVAERGEGLLGTLHLTFLPSLTHGGAWRAQIEGVRVAGTARGAGIGLAMLDDAIDRARQHGCRMIQLTSDKRRPDAIRFYEQAGFVASHEGLKRLLA